MMEVPTGCQITRMALDVAEQNGLISHGLWVLSMSSPWPDIAGCSVRKASTKIPNTSYHDEPMMTELPMSILASTWHLYIYSESPRRGFCILLVALNG